MVNLSWIFWFWKRTWVSKLNLGYFWFCQFTGASGEWLLIVLTPKPDWTASKIIWLQKCVLDFAANIAKCGFEFFGGWWLLFWRYPSSLNLQLKLSFEMYHDWAYIFLKSGQFSSQHLLMAWNLSCFCTSKQNTLCIDLSVFCVQTEVPDW